MAKAKPSIVVEIVEFSGIRLRDHQLSVLEKLLAEVSTAVAVRFLKPGATGNVLEDVIQSNLDRLTAALERSPSRTKARKELVEAAACVVGMLLAEEPPESVALAERAA